MQARCGPVRITSTNGPWPLHGVAASRRIEAAAQSTLPAGILMQRAGLAVARLARAAWPFAGQVEIWCGPGNNGGDGWVAARHLHQWGSSVHVIELGEAERLPADAAQARQAAMASGVRHQGFDQAATLPPAPALVVDALLGLGATRAPAAAMAAALAALQARGAPVLAVDLPSGLAAQSGLPIGADAARADATLSLLTLKPGLFTGLGRDHAGEVWFDDLDCAALLQGLLACGAADAWLAGPAAARAMPHATHKGSRGDLLVIGGAPGMRGAAWLAARAGLAAGAGRTYVSLLEDGHDAGHDAARPELMVRSHAWLDLPLLQQATVVCGCGGGSAVREVLPQVLLHSPRLVLDADALNAVAAEHALARLLQGRTGRSQATVLTPHPLEAARLLGESAQQVQSDRLGSARRLAATMGSVVALKGSGSVVATADTPPSINPSGNAALATAGTGDVLAGWIGGSWAQTPHEVGARVAAQAVWQHGRAAELSHPQGLGPPLLAADLIAALQSLR